MVNLAVAAKPGDQVQPKIRPTPDGGSYISWFDNDPNGHPPFGYDVYLQRLDANGIPQLTGGGLLLADLGMSSTQDYGLDVDAEGNALVTFLDDRRRNAVIVTVMKVTPDGTQLCGKKGRAIGRGTNFLGNPKITATSDGFAVAAWINGNNITLQRISAAGGRQWGVNGITVTAPAGTTYSLTDLHAGDDGSAIFSFVSAAGFTAPKHLLANKISPDGTLLWGASHVAVFDGGSLQFGNFPPFVTDGAGGAVFGWYEVSPLQSRAQHILADGSEAFPHMAHRARLTLPISRSIRLYPTTQRAVRPISSGTNSNRHHSPARGYRVRNSTRQERCSGAPPVLLCSLSFPRQL